MSSPRSYLKLKKELRLETGSAIHLDLIIRRRSSGDGWVRLTVEHSGVKSDILRNSRWEVKVEIKDALTVEMTDFLDPTL